MKDKLIFIGPIWTHYRSSVVNELLKINPKSIFFGASKYLSNIAINNNNNAFNIINKTSFTIFGHTFYWYHGLLNKMKIAKTDKIIISGFDPHMLHLIFIVLYLKYIKKNKFYWWSHANYGNQGRFGIFFRMIFYRLASGVLVYSKPGRDMLVENGLESRKIKVINNSINFEDYGWLNNSLSTDVDKDKIFNVIYIGKLIRAKKIEILIKATSILMKKEKKIYCTIIGDGNEEKLLKKLSHDEGLECHINFVGGKFGEDIYKFLLAADLLVIPGAVGLSIVHAFSYGIPIITSDNIKIHGPEIDLLNIGQNGDVFEGECANSLAQKILEWRNLLCNDFNNRYSKNCVESIITNGYLPNIVAKKIFEGIKN